MNVLAVYYVNEHLETLREDAIKRRLDRAAGAPSLRGRLAAAVARITGSVHAPVDPDWSFLPRIHDYPYRG